MTTMRRPAPAAPGAPPADTAADTAADAADAAADAEGARRGRRAWLVVAAFWTLLGLVESLKGYVTSSLRGIERSWWHVLVANMPWWWGWAALTPLIVWFAARVRLGDDRGRLRALAGHGAMAVACAVAHVAVVGTLFYFTATRATPAWIPGRPATVAEQLRGWLDTWMMLELVTYCGIVGAWHALDFHRRYRESIVLSARLASQTAELRLHAAEARLQALRMQVNPHFLFNALNAISGLVRTRRDGDAVRMLAGLGDLLRATIDREAEQETALRDELALLERYLDIERVRFADRLTVALDVAAGVADARVPTLILQPLVENALRHGIARRPGPGLVHIRAAREGARLVLEVRDTGEGPPPVTATPPREGIGLANTRARLEQLYGARAGLRLAHADGGGARAVVWLPYHC